jgi:DNA-binding NarL/FixJ family response regulator
VDNWREMARTILIVDDEDRFRRVHLPDCTGFELAPRLRSESPRAAIVMTSTLGRDDVEDEMVQESGALGFVPKTELSGDALSELIG